MTQMVKRLPTMQVTWVQSLDWEDLLEKEMATHSSTLAWKIPWTEEPGRLQSMGSQRVGHDRATSLSLSLFSSLSYICLHLHFIREMSAMSISAVQATSSLASLIHISETEGGYEILSELQLLRCLCKLHTHLVLTSLIYSH